MMIRCFVALAALFALLATACGSSTPQVTSSDEVVAPANSVATPLESIRVESAPVAGKIPESTSGLIMELVCNDDDECPAGFLVDGLFYDEGCDSVSLDDIADRDYAMGRYNGTDIVARRILDDDRSLAVNRAEGWDQCDQSLDEPRGEWARFTRS